MKKASRLTIRPAVFGCTLDEYKTGNHADKYVAVIQNTTGDVTILKTGNFGLPALMAMFGWDGNAGFEIDKYYLNEAETVVLRHILSIADETQNLNNPNAVDYFRNIHFFHTLKEDCYPDNGYEQHYSMKHSL